jgi:hypothetical protein
MYIIEYLSTTVGQQPTIHMELALGSTAEEAMDQANTHLPKRAVQYGAQSYRILDHDKRCIGIGPVGFLNTEK